MRKCYSVTDLQSVPVVASASLNKSLMAQDTEMTVALVTGWALARTCPRIVIVTKGTGVARFANIEVEPNAIETAAADAIGNNCSELLQNYN